METEIDLRPYFRATSDNWYWIVGVAVTFALIAFGISSLPSPMYRSTALISVIQPQDEIQFDPRFENVEESQPLKAFPELAVSDAILAKLIVFANAQDSQLQSMDQLRQIVKAEAGSDPRIIRLIVEHENNETAYSLAREWTSLFVDAANMAFGRQGTELLAYYEVQLEHAETSLNLTEQELIIFQESNVRSGLAQRLTSLEQTSESALHEQRLIAKSVRNLLGLKEHLLRQSTSVMTLADAMTAMEIQMEVFGLDLGSGVQFQIDQSGTLSNLSPEEQVAFLDSLLSVAMSKDEDLSLELNHLEPDILMLQGQIEQLRIEEDRLSRDRDVAEETYIALARKVQEERIATEEIDSIVRLIGVPIKSEQPISGNRFLTSAVAGVVGGLLAVAVIWARVWWQEIAHSNEGLSADSAAKISRSND